MSKLKRKVLAGFIAFALIMSQMAFFPGTTVSAATVIPVPNVLQPQNPGELLSFRFANNTNQAIPSRIVTFGQTFAEGDLPSGTALIAKAGGSQIPMQTNVKASHSDGSVRHAIFSVQLPGLSANGSVDVMMIKGGTPTSGANVDVADILGRGYDIEINLTLNGTTYVVKAQDILSAAIGEGNVENWFLGPLASEVRVKAPITPDNKLHCYFDIRSYSDGAVWTDVIIANDWSYVTGMTAPTTYDVALKKDGQDVVSYTALAHNQHANWHKEIWWSGSDPDINVIHDVNYLVRNGSVPQYDTSIGVNDNIIQSDYNSLTAANTAPMGNALVYTAMPGTGGRPDLGPTTAWNARYILSQDQRAWQVVLANANAGGSIPWHCRDDATGEYIRIDHRPELWIDDRDAGADKFPEPFSFEGTGWLLDTAHQPALQYIPYLFTGNHYYLDEMQAQSSYIIGSYDPGYNSGLGVFDHVNVRAIAWGLRDIADAAYITPDDHPLKDYFTTILNNNLDHYVQKYVTDRIEQDSGAIEGFFLDGYGPDSVAPWQQDYMAITLRYMAQRGYSQAAELLDWMYNFNAGRFINEDEGFNPLVGPGYWWWIKDSGGYFNSWAQLSAKNIAAGNISDSPAGLDGYPHWSGGYAANAKGALASLISSTNSPECMEAFAYLVGQTPAMTADYANDPSWLQAPMLADGTFLNYSDIRLMSAAGTLSGNNNNELLHGSAGNDTLYGSAGIDILYGGDGDDELGGGDGDDFLFGGKGSDRLNGGLGSDILKGGPGADADTFIFDAANSNDADTVLDFTPSEDTLEILKNLNENGMTTAAQVLSGATTSSGNTLLHLGDQYTVTLKGVLPEQLTESMITMVDSGTTPPPPPTPTPTPKIYNAAAGKTATTNGTINDVALLSRLTDGDRDRAAYVLIDVSAGPKWCQVDLEKELPIVELNLVNDYNPGATRTGRDIIIQLSNDPSFATGVTTVFNNDSDNSSGQGAGSDAEYLEPVDGSGKTVTLSAPVVARYVRVWSYGHVRTLNSEYKPSNTPVEIEVYVLRKFEINGALGKSVTTNASATDIWSGTLSLLTDGLKSDTSKYALINVADGPKYCQVDLETTKEITRVHLTNDWNPSSPRKGRDIIVQLSDDETFSSDVTTIFNNDTDNSSGQGAGTDAEYLEPVDGSGKNIVLASPVNARYVRVWSNGHLRDNESTHRLVNTPIEIEVFILTDDTIAPAAITNLSAGYITWKSVELNWTAPGNNENEGTALRYDIRYSTAPITADNWDSAVQVSGEPAPQVAGTAQSMAVDGLTAGTDYYFAMKASDEVGNTSGLSNVLTVTTSSADEEAPSAILDLVAERPNPYSVQLTWTAPGNDGNIGTAESYDIRYSTSPITDENFENAPQADITITPASAGIEQSFKVLELQTGVTYYFAVKTADESGNLSGLSNVVSATTQTYSPGEVTVSSLSELQSAINDAPFEGRIITLAAGTYDQSAQIYVSNKNNITIQGATSDFNDTVIAGQGINSSAVEVNLLIDKSDYITIKNLTLKDTYYHGVKIDNGSCYFRASNVKTWDNGESGYKITGKVFGTTVSNNYSDYGIIEDGLIGFTTEGQRNVVEGIDGIAAKGWIIRGNVVENVKKPQNGIAYGIFFKGNSIDTIVENNLLKDCFIALSFGGGGTMATVFRNGDTTYEHRGGIMRNNIVWGTVDTGIYMNQANGFKIYNNTVWSTADHPNSIESRFAGSSGEIKNNICSMRIANRDGGTSILGNNIAAAEAGMFVDAANGDFHLLKTATAAIDQGDTLAADVAFDFDGNVRPAGSAYDIGAYEYSSSVPTTPTYPTPTPAPIDGGAEITLDMPVVNAVTGEAVATVALEKINQAITKAAADSKGVRTVTLKIPAADGAKAYAQQLPVELFSSETSGASGKSNVKIQIVTEVGKLMIPTNMLSEREVANAKKIEIVLARADTSGLASDVKDKIGDRPVVEINLRRNGVIKPWSNPDAPAVVSIPYTPTAAELLDPEHIVVWYIDSEGNAIEVPTGRYDAATGHVVFAVSHFSKYAVAYAKTSFANLEGYVWAKKAIDVMASKGVISGISAENYIPSAAVGRAEFLHYLIKALGLSAKAENNFSDVDPAAFYAESVAIAKQLGIAKGVGNNKFLPEATITRQDAMTLLYQAMLLAGKDLTPGTEADLNKFADRERVASYAVPSVATLVKNGIVQGRGKESLQPLAPVTQAETAVLLYKVYNEVAL